jgi:diguanylate cyclase (GGDEF)-like protein
MGTCVVVVGIPLFWWKISPPAMVVGMALLRLLGGVVVYGLLRRVVAGMWRQQEQLRIERENLKAVFASSPVGMLLLDEETMIVDANSVVAGMVSRSLEQIIHQRGGGGLGCKNSLENEKGCGFAASCVNCPLRLAITRVLQEGVPLRGTEIQPELLIEGKVERPWLNVSTAPVQLNGKRHIIVSIENITERKVMEKQLRVAAETDRLTELPNRALFCDRLEQAILRTKRVKGYHFGVLFVDCDRFKTINDTLGHQAGDQLLQEVARRLRSTLRAGDTTSRPGCADTTARLGGDEFVVLLDGIASPADAEVAANRLLEGLSKPYHLGEHVVNSMASIGIVTSDVSADTAAEVLRDADTAMYEAKTAGKARWARFNVSMRQRLQRRLDLEQDLRHAVEADELFLMYQPIVSLRTGQVEGFEALVRWRHSRRGVIMPEEFIGIAEETDLIQLVGEWVLREGCRQFVAWREQLGNEAPQWLTVNLSRRQLMAPELPMRIEAILVETGMPAECLHLEVTESTVMTNAAATVEIMRAIKKIGVKLAIDDFGTGHSSLACLHQLSIDMLKIDRSFIANMNRDRNFTALVYAMMQLAQNLHICVVAEGIEEINQAIVLQSLDCDYGQGYLFSQPLEAEAVPGFKVSAVQMLPGEAMRKYAAMVGM